MSGKKIKVGIIANEFFDAKINRVGGFGWAARRAVDSFRSDPDFETPVFFSGEQLSASDLEVDGIRILGLTGSRIRDALRARRERVDILLTIDYRPSYKEWLKVMPRTTGVIWVRDPRTRAAVQRMNTLTVPQSNEPPGGIPDWNFHSLARFMERTSWLGREIVLACKMRYMREMIPDVFDLPESDVVLPNPDVVDYDTPLAPKSETPRVIFLARLDPVKRPWLFVELARHFPDVEFMMLGKNFVDDEIVWMPKEMPANLKLVGNVAGQEKIDLIASAWALVNTSIHEESAVSGLEALACETPLISYIESDAIAERFGTCLGYDTGDGFESMPRLVAAMKHMLEDHEWRQRMGREGRAWVMEEHNTTAFLESFKRIYRDTR